MQIKKELFGYILFFVAFATLFLLFAYNGYPLLGGDSYSFLPTSIHLNRGDGLINILYTPTGKSQMLFYPPFFPYFQSLFLFTNAPSDIFISLSITSLLCFATMMAVVHKLLIDIPNVTYRFFLFFFICIAIATGLDISSGRPEILVNLLMSLALLVYVYQLKHADYLYGIIFVLIGITSVVTGVYIFFIGLMLYIYTHQNRTSYLKFALSAATVFLLFLIVYPYSFLELLSTMLHEAQKIVFVRDDAYTLKEFAKYHFIYPTYTFYFLLFCAAVFIIAKKMINSYLLLGILTLLISAIYYFGFRNLAANYYIYNLYLLYFCIVIPVLVKQRFKIVAITFLGLCSLGFIRKTTLFFKFYDKGAVVNTVNAEISNFNIINFKENSSFWIFQYYQSDSIHTDKNYLIYQQLYSNGFNADTNAILVRNFSKKENFIFAGITIANNPPFYYYQLYRSTIK